MRNDADPKASDPANPTSDPPKTLEVVEKPAPAGKPDELAPDDLDKVSGGMFEMNKHL
jgi:hypothetical protein